MLLLTTHPFPNTQFGIWQIAEAEAFFREDLPLSVQEEAEWALHKGIRRLEWLAGRWLLHKLSGSVQRMPLAKTAFSKPFFPADERVLCSLSHSKGIVAALLLTEAEAGISIGCDIQVLVEKMPRIAHKFLSTAEMNFILQHSKAVQFDLFHAFWTAKESLYKAYGLKELDFSDHIRVHDFEWSDNRTEATGSIQRGDFQQHFTLLIEKMNLPETGELMHTVCMQKRQSTKGK